MNALKTNQKGFSIIEVVLVLAIAGLIFLMVFVALPALQRSQRDTGRRSDVGVVGAAVSSYASNNRGNLPPDSGELRKYIGDLSQYTSTQVNYTTGTGGTPTADTILVNGRAKCGTSGALVAGTSRQAAVRVALESGKPASGPAIIFCQDV